MGPNALWSSPPNQNFGWVMAHLAHAAAPPYLLLPPSPLIELGGLGESC